MKEHIDERRLYASAQHSGSLTDAERAHLRECEECQNLVKVFARQKLNIPMDKSGGENGKGNAA